MTRIRTHFCMDIAVIEFEDYESWNNFVLDPQFNFDFCIDNVDDKEGGYRIFGDTCVSPEYTTGEPRFLVTYVRSGDDEERIAEVSVSVKINLFRSGIGVRWKAFRAENKVVCNKLKM